MIGRLLLDLTFQNKFLLNEVAAHIRLIHPKHKFCLLRNANQSTEKVSLKEVCRKVKPKPAVQLAHVQPLLPNCELSCKTSEHRQHGPAGNTSFTKKFLSRATTHSTCRRSNRQQFLQGREINKSPLNFKHNRVNFICLYVDVVGMIISRI